MKIAIDAAKFSPAEANELRKAMATFRSRGTIGALEDKMVGRMVARGYDPEFAKRCFDQIKGFGEYGFPESHAASFALLVYVSSWIKCHFPDVFCAALLNSQPMGFYAPAQIVCDARKHGVEVRQPDVNYSGWDTTLEPTGAGRFAVRLGLRQVEGLRHEAGQRIMAHCDRPYGELQEVQERAGLSAAALRRQALWQAKALKDAPDLPLFRSVRDEGPEPPVPLPVMPVCEQVVEDYRTLHLSLKAHPLSFLRKSLRKQHYISAAELRRSRNGQAVKLAGLVLVRQRPGSAKGVCFITIEDETGVANLVVWPKVMANYRKAVMQSRLLAVQGHVQRDVEIIHVVARSLEDRSDALLRLASGGSGSPRFHADGTGSPPPVSASRHPRDMRIVPKSRDFH